MTSLKSARLSDVLDNLAPVGSNDARWFLVEHQMVQAKMCLQVAHATLLEIAERPENREEGFIARDCAGFVKSAYVDFLAQYSAFLAYIAGNDVSERIGRKEVKNHEQ